MVHRLESVRHLLISLSMSLIFVLSFTPCNHAASTSPHSPNALLQRAKSCTERLYRSPAKKKYRHNWERCLKRHEKVYKGFPDSDEAVHAMLGAGQLWAYLYRYSSKDSDLDEAVSLLRGLVKQYSTHDLADDAQYTLGEIFYKYKKDPVQAYVEFLKVEVRFPKGDARVKASQMMKKLERHLGKKRMVKKAKAGQSELILVEDIRHWSTPTYTRVVIDLGNQVKYREHLLKMDPDLKKPRRLFVDLANARISKDIESSIPIRDGLLRRARAAQYDRRTVRVVLDIDNMEGYKIFHLYDPFRIVVDVQGKDRKVGPLERKSFKSPVSEKSTDKGEQEHISLAKQLGLGVKRIVIDPGHGGRDPGAIGINGEKEKDIMLELAKLVAQKVESELGCEAILTRANDVFLPLEKRTAIANMKKGDLFVSLHTNAHRNRKIRGVETYILNIALDEDAMNLAARENATSRKNISDLQMILNDLMLNTKINESSRLARFVHKALVRRLREKDKTVRDRGVRQAPFYVLIGAEMPAILVEVGYITNPTENRQLRRGSHLERVASGIVKGIDSYVKDMEVSFKGG